MSVFITPDGSFIDGAVAGKTFILPDGSFLNTQGASVLDMSPTAVVAVAGTLALTGDIDAFGRYWRIPTNSSGTFNVSILSGAFPHSTVDSGVVTVAGGFLDVRDTTGMSAGTKRFAFIHDWDFVLTPTPTSIHGGAAIATLTLV